MALFSSTACPAFPDCARLHMLWSTMLVSPLAQNSSWQFVQKRQLFSSQSCMLSVSVGTLRMPRLVLPEVACCPPALQCRTGVQVE